MRCYRLYESGVERHGGLAFSHSSLKAVELFLPVLELHRVASAIGMQLLAHFSSFIDVIYWYLEIEAELLNFCNRQRTNRTVIFRWPVKTPPLAWGVSVVRHRSGEAEFPWVIFWRLSHTQKPLSIKNLFQESCNTYYLSLCGSGGFLSSLSYFFVCLIKQKFPSCLFLFF